MKNFFLLLFISILIVSSSYAKLLDNMDSIKGWAKGGESGTKTDLKSIKGKKGKAIEFLYELSPGRWVQIQKAIKKKFTKVRALQFEFKGSGAPNNLQVKLEDADGSTYGITYEGVTSNDQWQTVVIPFSDMTYWWGGDDILDLKNIKNIYFTVTQGNGGKGSIIIDQVLILNKLPKNTPKIQKKYKRLIKSIIDDMNAVTGWQVGGENQANASISSVPGKIKKAIEIDYDFVDGKWIQAQKAFNLNISANNNAFSFIFKASGKKNMFQLKIEDVDGSVFGKDYPGMTSIDSWKEITIPINSLQYYWGGDQNLALDKIVKIYLTIVSEEGGKGKIYIDELKLK